MSDVSQFALTIIIVVGSIWIIKSSWQGSLKWVSQQGTDLNMSDSWQQVWRGIARVLGPVGAALFYLFNPNLDKSSAKQTPHWDDELPTGGFEEQTQAEAQTLPPNTGLYLSVTKSRNAKGSKVGLRYDLVDGTHSIGREPTPEPRVKTIAIQGDKAVSANHVYLSIQDDGSFTVTDRQSTYGTRVNGHRLNANEPFPFKPGDTLKLGNTTLTLCRNDEKSIAKAKVVKKQYRLRVVQGTDKGKKLNINKDRLTIGRAKESHLHLNDKKVSRQHAEIRREGAQIVITDLGSTHGMSVNALDIASRSLTVGDTIKLGDTILTFEEV